RVGRMLRRPNAPRERRDNPIVFLDIKVGDEHVGRLTIELRADVVPKTAENIRRLCTGETMSATTGKRRHYAHCPIHRVVKNRFCQSGDFMNHDGSGGESTFDPPEEESFNSSSLSGDEPKDDTMRSMRYFEDENFILRHVGAGVLSMVNSGPDSNACQFYLHFAANPDLDGLHVVFGALLGEDSYKVLKAIHAVASERGESKKPVKIANAGQLYPN
ncbi:TPA: hypothetical protein N0F65_002936, partial [Lagenidium giganteum]